MNNFQNILNQRYSLKEFKQNILLPVFQHNTSDFQFYQTPMEEQLNESETRIAKSILHYGELTTQDGVNVNFYEVKLQPKVVIEHNRVTVGVLIRRLLLENAAFVNFVYTQDDKPDWRFSFIFKGSVINKETEEYEDKETEPKRFTYLLGPNESCRTVAENLQKIAENPEVNIQDIENAFSLEKLSKEFFENYKKHYELFINHIINSPSLLSHFKDNDREKQVRDFVKKMLGRIVFLYFIQKKGWLGASTTEYKEGKQDFMPELFNKSEKDSLFYANYLEPLFYETLNKSRADDICIINGKELGKVPFLNGGLFEPEFKNGHLLTFPPELFKNLFEFFNNYNFTIIENDPLNRNVAVDPEMLGHIFENLLEDNKDKGAYYTPKEIVHYMCQESLIEYLKTKLTGFGNLSALESDIEEFIKHKRSNEFIHQNARTINTALDNVKVCDPAIGSGAFPVGLLMEIYTAKQALQEISENKIEKESPADIKQHIIQNSIYGVDIEKGAVDIARLRFWLSLIIDEKLPKALPNLDYKIVEGNSLVPMFEGEVLDIDWTEDTAQYGAFAQDTAKEINTLLKKITEKQKAFFDSKTKNKKEKKEKLENLKIDLLIKQLQLMIKIQGLEQVQSSAKGKALKQQTELFLKTEGWKKAIKKLEAIKGNKEKQLKYFNWQLDFAEMLNADVVGSDNESTTISVINRQIVAINMQIAAINSAIKNNTGTKILKLKLISAKTQLSVADIELDNIEKRINKLYGNISFIGKNVLKEPTSLDYEVSSINKGIEETNVRIFEINKKLKKNILKDTGFDIVIGNPPYVRADNPQFASQREMIMQSGNYNTLWEKWDLMVPFIEKGLKLLNPNGNLSFIVSNSITTSKFAYKLQDWIIENYQLKSVDYFENIKVFDAGVIPVILSIRANKKNNLLTKKILRSGSFENKEVSEINTENTNTEALRATLFKKRYNQAFNPDIDTIRVGDICYLSYGLRPNSNERFWKGEFSKDDVISDIKTENFIQEYVEGKDIKEYKIEKIKYLEWGTDRVPSKLVRPTFPALYKGDKIFRGRVTKGTFDNTGIVCNDSIVVLKRFADLKGINERSITSSISKNNLSEQEKKLKGGAKKLFLKQRRKELETESENYSLKYILAVINSKYAMAYLNNFRRHRLENYFYPDDFRNYPLPKASQAKQKTLEILVDYLLYLNKDEVAHLPQSENILTAYFEQIINGCVYELYFPEVLKENNREVFKYLADLIPIDIDGDKLEIEIIANIFNELYKPDHLVRKNLYYMDSLTEIRIVEGKHTH